MSVYQGKITRIDEDGQLWAEIAELAVDQEFPCRNINVPLSVGDFVLVINITGAQEDLVIIGKLLSSVTNKYNDDIEITDSAKGVILKAPNGTRYRVKINNSGVLTTTVVV